MAKVQGKKAAITPKKSAAAKPVARAKTAKLAAKKPVVRAVAKAKTTTKKKLARAVTSGKKAAAKKAAPKKVAPKKAALKKAAPKKAAPKKAAGKATPGKATKPAPTKASLKKPAVKAASGKTETKPAPRAVAKPTAKAVPKRVGPAPSPAVPARAAKAAEGGGATRAKSGAKGVSKAAASGSVTAVARVAAPAADEKKKRRSRTRVTSSGPATAAWFSQGDRPRSSSFIPAPPRAEAPSLVAAPPASSDRLVGSHELTEFAVRTVPVRIDIEAGGGKIYLAINPNETTLKVGEGIEWDFRYLGGADVVIEELIIEFAKPSPFTTTVFRSRRPGAARPHRQLSGPAQASASGKHLQYNIRAFNGFKTEMAVAKPALVVT